MRSEDRTVSGPAAPERPASSSASDADHRHDLKSVIRRLGPAGPLAILSVTLPPLGGFLLIAFTSPVAQWLRGHQELGIVFYLVGFWVLSGLAFLPTYAQAVVGGWAFGFARGFPAALGGFIGGALIGYAIGRFVTGERALRIISEERKWRAVYDALLGSGFWRTLGLITLIRLNSPFSFVSFFFGATRTNVVAYVLGTAAGLTPRTAAAVWIAQSIKDVTEKPHLPKWLVFTSVAAAIVIVLVIGKLASDAVHRVTGAEAGRDDL